MTREVHLLTFGNTKSARPWRHPDVDVTGADPAGPLLRNRGLFPPEHGGSTSWQHLGLATPDRHGVSA